MREILFHGKDHLGYWHVGSLVQKLCDNVTCANYYANSGMCNHTISVGDYYIIDENGEGFWVSPETIGQYTGLPDKNEKKIFEGDIVRTKKFGRIIGHANVNDFDVFKVQYEPCVFRLVNKNRGFNLVDDGLRTLEVIGNIHDNPELLEDNA